MFNPLNQYCAALLDLYYVYIIKYKHIARFVSNVLDGGCQHFAVMNSSQHSQQLSIIYYNIIIQYYF